VSGELALLRARGYEQSDAVQRALGTAVMCDGCGSGRIDAAAAVGAGSAPPPALPPGGGGAGATAPGSATVVGAAPAARPASGGPARTASPRTTVPPTVAVTAPTTTVPPTSSTSGPAEAALGIPFPGQVQKNSPPPSGGEPSSRLAATGLALAGLLGAGAALGVRVLRRTG
jgi:hypothetical protein